ncbi:MAG: tetratricopeptide repeat protein [Rhodopirellula sp.]|nr:tetratricopeptide repeat protein [Rhodopirellula sp.]
MAYEGRDTKESVRQTAGQSPVTAVSSSIKQGVGKITDFFTPDPVPVSRNDPTSLANASSPGPELYVAMARLNEQTGKGVEAEQQYRKALAMRPDDPDALVGLARLKDRQGRLDEALELYRRAAEAGPSVAAIHNDLGLCCARNRNTPEAVTALRRAVELEPRQKLYRNNLAAVLVESGDNEAAFEHLLAAHGEAAACYNLGYLVQKKGQTDLARKLFAKAVQKDPSLGEARVWLERLQSAEPAGGTPPAAIASAPRPPMSASVVRQLPPTEARPGSAVAASLPPSVGRDVAKTIESPLPWPRGSAPALNAPLPADLSVGPNLHPLPPVDATAK